MKQITTAWLIGIAWVTPAFAQGQDSLERGLLRQAPELIKHCQKQGYKNVGVLKFLVSRDGKTLTDNVGTLNLLLARRLEVSLILANDPRTPIGILKDASGVAGTIAGANHLTKDGREKLLAGQYPLAWGKEKVQPDAFVTGAAEISRDLKKLTVSLLAFDKSANKLVPLGEDFVVRNSADRLTEMGESFVLRTGRAAPIEEDILQDAVKVREQESKHPQQQDGVVTLEFFYDKQKVQMEFRDGKAFVPEPREGQEVHFVLRRDASKERYGVVLKVNGENTLEKQRTPDATCLQWVLAAGGGPWGIHGYQIGDQREKFRVAAPAESKQREIDYGKDVGTITMTVFRESKEKVRPKAMDDDELSQTVVQKLREFPERPKNFHALKAQLLEDANRGPSVRGLIVPGERETLKVKSVPFTADPTPIMGVTIVYYRSQR